MSPVTRQIDILLRDVVPARLVVFVSRPQLGTALQRAIVRARGSAVGLHPTPPTQYATDLAGLSLRADGRTELEAGPRFFLADRVLQALPDATRTALTEGQPIRGMIGPLVRTVTTLRTHGITPEEYRQSSGPSDFSQALSDAFARYEEALSEQGYYDEAILYRRAIALVENGTVSLPDHRWAILNTVSLSGVKYEFVSALVEHTSPQNDIHLLGPGGNDGPEASGRPGDAPVSLAAAQFAEAPSPGDTAPSGAGAIALGAASSLSEGEAEALRFWTATGVRREVQAVFEDLLDRDRALDTVEIAYTTPTPYLPLIDTLAERYDLPVSLSGGRAVEATRPGQALAGFFDWIAGGGAIPGLIGLLRAGLVTIDRTVERRGTPIDTLDHRHAATLLAQRRYSDDPAAHPGTLTAWITELDEEIAALDDVGSEDWVENRRTELRNRKATIRALRAEVESLLALGHLDDPASVRLTDFAESVEQFLENYEPTAAPPEDEEARNPDESARNMLIDRLQRLQREGGDTAYRPRRLAQHMSSWLPLTPYVRAQKPQPGCVHVVPLESAGVADRDHLYVVGLDAASTSTHLPEDPLLNDEQRQALSDGTTVLPRRRSQVDVEEWRARQALARHSGTLTLTASTYDLDEDEDLFEAPLYLRLKEASKAARGDLDDADDPRVRHSPLAPTRTTVLSDLDRWTSRPRPPSDAVDKALTERDPWLRDGLDAEEARAAETYTAHDGLLSPREYPGLNPLAQTRPVTAGRLEHYAQSPFGYFLRHILDVTPLDEPALDDVAWLDALQRGTVLHDTFRRFMIDVRRHPTRDDRSVLHDHFDAVLQTYRERYPPPSEVVYATTRRALWTDALLFLRVEAARTDDSVPHAFERGFGDPSHRRKDPDDAPTDYDTAPTLQFSALSFALRGRVDRVDRFPDGSLALWDYKTGSSRDYDDTDLLSGGTHLQWALYAYALEALEDTDVSAAGYFFTSTEELGKRMSADPSTVRTEVGRRLHQIAEGTAAGAFPITDADGLQYDFERLFHDYSQRQKQLRRKTWPTDRPAPPPLRDE